MAYTHILPALLVQLVSVIHVNNAAFFSCSDVVEKMSDCKQLTETKGTFQHRDLTMTYWVYSDLENHDDLMDPVILIHGGPGVPSMYMESLKQLACRGRKVIRYDQGGVGDSFVANVSENAPFLLDLDYYPGEVYALMDHLGFKSYHVLGHSWGTIVAQEFAMTNPTKVSSLLLVGALSSGRFYIESQRNVRHSTLPPYLQKLIKQFEENGEWDSPLFQELNHYLTGLWTIRTMPMPDCVEEALEKMNQEIYVAINGPSEFTMADKLMEWNVTGLVDGDRYPTTVIGGEHDSMTYDCLKQVSGGIRNSELKIIPNAGHISYVDNPDLFMDYAQDFMLRHDSGAESGIEVPEKGEL